MSFGVECCLAVGIDCISFFLAAFGIREKDGVEVSHVGNGQAVALAGEAFQVRFFRNLVVIAAGDFVDVHEEFVVQYDLHGWPFVCFETLVIGADGHLSAGELDHAVDFFQRIGCRVLGLNFCRIAALLAGFLGYNLHFAIAACGGE